MILNAVLLALRELRRNLMRSMLTTLGVVIGVSAVIIMVILGNGATELVTAGIASLGSNLLTLVPGQRRGPSSDVGTATAFQIADADSLRTNVPSLADVAPMSSQQLSVVLGNKNRSSTVTGTTNAYFSSGNWTLREGHWFTDADERAGRAVCIIGETVRRELVGAQSPLGVRIRIRSMSCEVIGLLGSKGKNTFGQDRDDTVVIPIRTFQRRIGGRDVVGQIQMTVGVSSSMLKAQQDIERLMRERRHLSPGEDNDFTVLDMQEVARTLSGTTRLLTLLLAAIAAISLIVGGIGIMNIMIVSVTERTREIGIRMAIGALEREVLLQFMIEAVVLSVFGGAIGIVLALGLSLALTMILALPFSIDSSIVVLSFVFSGLVGIVFGFVPALRAARLNPIDALRHE